MNYLDDELATRVRTQLELTTRSIPTSVMPPAAITRRAVRRQSRRRVVSVTSSIVLVGLTAAGAVAVLNRDPRTVVSSPDGTQPPGDSSPAPIGTSGGDQTPSSTAPAAPAAPRPLPGFVHNNLPKAEFTPLAATTVAASDMVWNRIDVDTAEALTIADTRSLALSQGGPAALYAVDTEPGQAAVGVKPQVWNSTDGIHWNAVSEPMDGLGKLGVGGDGKVYSLATVASGAAAGQPSWNLATRISSDGGRTWGEAETLIDLDEVRKLPAVSNAYVVLSDIAASDDRVLVLAKPEINIDWGSLDPRLANRSWQISGNGSAIELIQPCELSDDVMIEAKATGVDPCPRNVTGVIPLAGLVDPRVLRELNRVHLFTSTDGERFEEIDTNAAGLPRHGGGAARLTHTDRGFLYVASLWSADNRGVERYFESADGQEWTELTQLDVTAGAMTTALGLVDGRYTTVNSSGAVLRLADNGEWEGVDLSSLIPSTDPFAWTSAHGAVSESGITAIFQGTVDEIAKMGGIELTSPEGYTVRRDSMSSELVVTDRNGKSVVAFVDMAGPNTATLKKMSNPNGENVQSELLTTWTSPNINLLFGGESGSRVSYILRSKDGVAWSVEPLEFGANDYIQSVSLVGPKVIVRVSTPRPAGQPSTQMMLVGTPKG
jgi:hypothetical protein